MYANFMKRIKFLEVLIVAAVLLVSTATIYAQPAFYKDVQALKSKDSAAFPPRNAILFTGSSSFTKWTGVQDSFPKYNIINRAFGGSSLPDLIRYADDVILPYQPKQVVIYCGDNDLASSDSITPQIVTDRFIRLFNLIRSRLPKTHILYVSIKPSPSRERLMPKMVETNTMIKNFLKKQRRTSFADVYSKMLLADGKPNPELFIVDNLHMNEKGYAIWKDVLKPYLKK
jgi:lysophospholipase L1-like esterase